MMLGNVIAMTILIGMIFVGSVVSDISDRNKDIRARERRRRNTYLIQEIEKVNEMFR